MMPLQDAVPGAESAQTKPEGGDLVSQIGRMTTS